MSVASPSLAALAYIIACIKENFSGIIIVREKFALFQVPGPEITVISLLRPPRAFATDLVEPRVMTIVSVNIATVTMPLMDTVILPNAAALSTPSKIATL
jgi:hypothetical protein